MNLNVIKNKNGYTEKETVMNKFQRTVGLFSFAFVCYGHSSYASVRHFEYEEKRMGKTKAIRPF